MSSLKNKTTLNDEINTKVLSMFSAGMSYRDINKHVEDIYEVNVSTGIISSVTDKLIPEFEQWQQSPLDSHYPIVWLAEITICRHIKYHRKIDNANSQLEPLFISVGYLFWRALRPRT